MTAAVAARRHGVGLVMATAAALAHFWFGFTVSHLVRLAILSTGWHRRPCSLAHLASLISLLVVAIHLAATGVKLLLSHLSSSVVNLLKLQYEDYTLRLSSGVALAFAVGAAQPELRDAAAKLGAMLTPKRLL